MMNLLVSSSRVNEMNPPAMIMLRPSMSQSILWLNSLICNSNVCVMYLTSYTIKKCWPFHQIYFLSCMPGNISSRFGRLRFLPKNTVNGVLWIHQTLKPMMSLALILISYLKEILLMEIARGGGDNTQFFKNIFSINLLRKRGGSIHGNYN